MAPERELVDLVRGMTPKDRAAILQLARTIGRSAVTPTLQSPKGGFKHG